MKVLKFGGTSVGTADSLRNVKSIVEACTEQAIVVVSALSGVTNQLVEMARLASAHDSSYEDMLGPLLQRHLDLIEQVVPPQRRDQCRGVVEPFINESLRSSLSMLDANEVVAPALEDAVENAILCHGEILSSAIVTSMIDDAVPHFAPNFIKTRDNDTERIIDWEATTRLTTAEFADQDLRCHVVQGFIAGDVVSGIKTTLGRGGSDFTAAIIASILGASALEIWTDVDGFMTADPRTNPDAEVIPRMTYRQAQEMCDAGAKVIYPPTIAPVAMMNIPVWVKNTFNPTAPGTVIEN